jgi:hypothetical protein
MLKLERSSFAWPSCYGALFGGYWPDNTAEQWLRLYENEGLLGQVLRRRCATSLEVFV